MLERANAALVYLGIMSTFAALVWLHDLHAHPVKSESLIGRSLPGFAEGVLGDSTHKSSQIFANLTVAF
jgi:hypothetical protein